MNSPPTLICVVPVRMTEAWLLTCERSIRAAVGNQAGSIPLELPASHDVESVGAKRVLFHALTLATELGANRRRKFRPEAYPHSVAEFLDTLTSLRKLKSFQRLEAQIKAHFGAGPQSTC